MHDMYKGNSNQVVCCLGSKSMQWDSTVFNDAYKSYVYGYDESCVKTFCKLHTCNTSSLTVTQRVSNLILASNPPRMAMVSITQHKPIGGLQETSHERARKIVKLNHCSPRLTYFL